jgi:sialidase-1
MLMINRLTAGALGAAITFSLPGARQAPPSLVQTDIFVGGDRGYHTFRIPSIVSTSRDTLLAFAEGRHDAAADSGHIDLVARRSTDAGLTWSPLQVVGDNGPDAWVNPCALVDRKTGTLWLLSTQNRASDKEKEITAGTSRSGITVWALRSDDDGVTWSKPIDITASVKRPEWTWYATGPGIGIQTQAGRLVVPANHADDSGVHRSHLFYSDDGGNSWTLGAIATSGTNESQIVELADGRLMHNMRNHPPKPSTNFRVVGISTDGGRTYAAPPTEDPLLIEPPAQASILRYSVSEGGGRNRLLFSNPASASRERMTVRVSYDEGQTWTASRLIHEGHSAYSNLVRLPDGRIGLLYERGEKSAYERLTFATFTLDWLESGRDGVERR